MSVKILSPVRTHFLFKAFYTSPLLYFTEQWLLSSTFHQESCRILGKLSWPGTRPAARRSTPLLLLLPFKANTPGPSELEILAFLAGSKLSGSQWWSPSLCKLWLMKERGFLAARVCLVWQRKLQLIFGHKEPEGPWFAAWSLDSSYLEMFLLLPASPKGKALARHSEKLTCP